MTAAHSGFEDLTALFTGGLGSICHRLMVDLAEGGWADLDRLSDDTDGDVDEFSEAVRHLLATGYVIIRRDSSSRLVRLTRRGRAAADRARAVAT